MLPILHQSYWRDEAFSVLLASRNLKDVLFLTIKDTSPPLYYFLLHFWIRFFGDAGYVTRSLSLLFFFLLVLSSFFLLKHLLKNRKISLLGSLGILLNPFLVEYAFEARAYMFFAFLIVTTTLFYLKKKRLLSSLFLTMAILTHNFAIFFLIAFIAAWLYDNKERLWEKKAKFISSFLLPILAFIGWLKFSWNQWIKVAEGFWIEPKTSSIFVDAFRVFFQGSLDYPSRAMLYNLSLILVFMGLSYWLVKIATGRGSNFLKKDNASLVFLFSIPFLIVYIISSFWVPIYHERYLIPILPLFIIWIIYSLLRLSKINTSLSYLIFAFSLAYILFAVQGGEEIMRKTTKPAINYGVNQILSQSQPGDVIIPESNLNFLETKYYVKKSGKDIPVFAYSPSGKIIFYLGSILFEKSDIVSSYPENKRIWIIKPDGGYYLKGED